MDSTYNLILIGVFFLGLFVGAILGRTLGTIGNFTIRLASTLIGAALGESPLLFMRDIGVEKWMYPIGLVFGLLWGFRVPFLMRIDYAPSLGSVRGRRVARLALIEFSVIIAATAIVLIVAAFVRQRISE